jgi:quinoprotein glucose dehydrogenase
MVGGGIPIGKPPYGTLTAIDLAGGVLRWQIAAGDMPAVRQNARLAGLTLPRLGAFNHSGAIVTRGGLVFFSAADGTLYAVDKTTGAAVWDAPLGAASDATPMTCATRSGRQLVVVAAGAGPNASLVAFALPEGRSGS